MRRPVLIGDWNYYAILRSSGLPTRSRTPSFRSSMRPTKRFLGGIQIFLYKSILVLMFIQYSFLRFLMSLCHPSSLNYGVCFYSVIRAPSHISYLLRQGSFSILTSLIAGRFPFSIYQSSSLFLSSRHETCLALNCYFKF